MAVFQETVVSWRVTQAHIDCAAPQPPCAIDDGAALALFSETKFACFAKHFRVTLRDQTQRI